MIKYYWQLMRFHKPIGIFLLLWPTLWALWIASNGHPSLKNIFIFVLGTIIMRAAGCVINDIADQRLDLHVARTRERPITSGKISTRDAMKLLFALCFSAFVLVLFTNALTILLACFAVLIAIIYPFMKRYTHWPQLVLGVAFSFSIPMAFAAETGEIPMIAVILMLANIAWTIAYDTEYAMVDRDDDIKIGIKSTAILFGRYDQFFIGLFQLIALGLLYLIGWLEHFSLIYFIALIISALLFIYQHCLMSRGSSPRCREGFRAAYRTLMCARTNTARHSNLHRERQRVSVRQAGVQAHPCLRAFLNNQWVGCVVFIGLCLNKFM